ncbi:MAG: hypothetical protein A2845_04150 [Candidatus Lloydbacteria bacterium RIFCSPHIGHO2_01_FULL_49_22]|uniref:Uncharacterized protein n=1 Tax=Candidatus Lloydbacteria bacterium RIFCSPHIGHO2_01_FULL_49_22 TaxID=1798658 RepID=A0A1G2CX83_9BACT|nr:MAG: hypothetical protein A2845_04150 [Candidatus Lloydbacteria bacterium RIFCSPHIGHO2_01_FULL_49_22]OGZ09118.1 MAG: hypothetical protein A3C14_03985 [Candidatus Lloydbacteria bacterium RIFCSPHIGHO2_02_FULL_50_18]
MKFLLHAVVRMVVLGSFIILVAFGLFQHPTFAQKIGAAGVIFVFNSFAVYLSIKEVDWKNVRLTSSLPPIIVIAIVPFCVMIVSGLGLIFIIWKNYF